MLHRARSPAPRKVKETEGSSSAERTDDIREREGLSEVGRDVLVLLAIGESVCGAERDAARSFFGCGRHELARRRAQLPRDWSNGDCQDILSRASACCVS